MGKSCCETSVVLPKAPLYNLFDNGAAIYLSFEKSWFLVWRKEIISAWLDALLLRVGEAYLAAAGRLYQGRGYSSLCT